VQLQIFPDYEALSAAAAAAIAAVVRAKPEATLCLASGNTPEGTFRHLVRMAADGDPDFSRCTFIGLDEWVGIPPENPGSCFYAVNEHLFKPLRISPKKIHFFNALAADLTDECHRMDDLLSLRGGLDLILLGVGLNGHLALNEPGTPWTLGCHVRDLDETTKTVGQKYFGEATTLTQGITVGLRHVQQADQAVLIASGRAKAGILRRALEEPPTEAVPASFFQTLDRGWVLLDEAAAGELGVAFNV
jgi:galactosamine-6-phosphate isomerase